MEPNISNFFSYATILATSVDNTCAVDTNNKPNSAFISSSTSRVTHAVTSGTAATIVAYNASSTQATVTDTIFTWNGADDFEELTTTSSDYLLQSLITRWFWIVSVLILPLVVVTLPAIVLFCIYSVSKVKLMYKNQFRCISSSTQQKRGTSAGVPKHKSEHNQQSHVEFTSQTDFKVD